MKDPTRGGGGSDLFRAPTKGRRVLVPILGEIVVNEYGQCASYKRTKGCGVVSSALIACEISVKISLRIRPIDSWTRILFLS